MVADEKDHVGPPDVLHHHERFPPADDHLCPGVEFLQDEVAHPIMGLVDDELCSSALGGSLDGGVHIGG
jgi:hypothetical protein